VCGRGRAREKEPTTAIIIMAHNFNSNAYRK